MTAVDDAKEALASTLEAYWADATADAHAVVAGLSALIDARLAACVATAQVVIPVPPGFTVDAPVGRPGHGPSGSVGCCACGHVHQRADFCDWGNAFECCPCTWPHAAPAATERAEDGLPDVWAAPLSGSRAPVLEMTKRAAEAQRGAYHEPYPQGPAVRYVPASRLDAALRRAEAAEATIAELRQKLQDYNEWPERPRPGHRDG